MGVSRAVEMLRAARELIVRTAADWQARGIDTSALTQPLIEIQNAIAELEAAGALPPARGVVASKTPRPVEEHYLLRLDLERIRRNLSATAPGGVTDDDLLRALATRGAWRRNDEWWAGSGAALKNFGEGEIIERRPLPADHG